MLLKETSEICLLIFPEARNNLGVFKGSKLGKRHTFYKRREYLTNLCGEPTTVMTANGRAERYMAWGPGEAVEWLLERRSIDDGAKGTLVGYFLDANVDGPTLERWRNTPEDQLNKDLVESLRLPGVKENHIASLRNEINALYKRKQEAESQTAKGGGGSTTSETQDSETELAKKRKRDEILAQIQVSGCFDTSIYRCCGEAMW